MLAIDSPPLFSSSTPCTHAHDWLLEFKHTIDASHVWHVLTMDASCDLCAFTTVPLMSSTLGFATWACVGSCVPRVGLCASLAPSVDPSHADSRSPSSRAGLPAVVAVAATTTTMSTQQRATSRQRRSRSEEH